METRQERQALDDDKRREVDLRKVMDHLYKAAESGDGVWCESLESLLFKNHKDAAVDWILKRMPATDFKVLYWFAWCMVNWCSPSEKPEALLELAERLKAIAEWGEDGKWLGPLYKNRLKMSVYAAMATWVPKAWAWNVSLVANDIVICLLERLPDGMIGKPSPGVVAAARAFWKSIECLRQKNDKSGFNEFAKQWWAAAAPGRGDDNRNPFQHLLCITMGMTGHDREGMAKAFIILLRWLKEVDPSKLRCALHGLSSSTHEAVVVHLSEGFLDPPGPHVLHLGIFLRFFIGGKVKLTRYSHLAGLMPPTRVSGALAKSSTAPFLLAASLWKLDSPLSRAAYVLLCMSFRVNCAEEGKSLIDITQGLSMFQAMKVSFCFFTI